MPISYLGKKSAAGARLAGSGAGWTAVLESSASKQQSAWLNASGVVCASPWCCDSTGHDATSSCPPPRRPTSCAIRGRRCGGLRLVCSSVAPRARKDWLPIFTTDARFTIAVNKVPIVNVGLEFEAEALRVLRSIPELAVTVDNERDPRGDAAIRYAGVEIPVALEFKARVSSAAAHQIVHRARQYEMPTVVIAAEMTGRAREILDGAGIGSIDGLGNVRLALPGLLMRITGTTRPRRPAVPTRLSGKSSVVVQAMLLDVERSWHVSDLTQSCGVSAGLAHRVLRRLEDEGVVTADGVGPRKVRRISNPAALLDLWAEEHHDRPTRRPVFLLAQTTDQMIDILCEGLETAAVDYALTGAAAAARIAPFVTSVPVAEVWLSSTAATSEVCDELGATPVESGPNVVLLQERDDAPLAFRTHESGVWTANVFRLYVDARRDPQRGREQSDHLRREVIGF